MIDVASQRRAPETFSDHAATAILHRLNFGVLVVDEEARILSANRRGWSYVSAGDGLMETEGGLTAEIGFEGEALRATIMTAVRLGRPGAILLRRSKVAQPLTLLVEHLGADGGGAGLALITVREAGRASPRLAERARMLFNFSPAEAEIVARVAQGLDAAEIAAERKVSINTLRVQMASAMVKVGVHRQAELIGMMSSADLLD